MALRNAMVNAGDGFVDRLLCVAGAAGLSQAPEFIQQYLQRLGGHVDEAQRQLAQYQKVADQSHLSLNELIAQTSASPASGVSRLGQVMSEAVTRLHQLQEAQFAISHAPAWKQPLIFFEHLDPQIAHGTWTIFRPAVPITAEGLIYGIAGMLLLLALYHALVRYPISRGYHRWKKRRTPRAEPMTAT